MPKLEMHTSALYKKQKLLVIGGRGFFDGENFEDTKFSDIIYSIDILTGLVEKFGSLPCDLAAHTSALVDDKYLIIYGGTNGLRIFDSVIRYDIDNKK